MKTSLRRVAGITGIALGAAIVSVGVSNAGGLLVRNRVEQPAFDVVGQVPSDSAKYEIRRYAPRLVAEVEVEGTAEQATSAGFSILAEFIFGGNVEASDIEMTSPVDQKPRSNKIEMTSPVDRAQRGNRWVVTFTMPKKWTKKTLPRPNSSRIEIREIPTQTFVVDEFSGSPSAAELVKREGALRSAVEAAGYRVDDAAVVLSRFDPPWTPSMLRKNALSLEIVWTP